MQPSPTYKTFVEGKTAEQILADGMTSLPLASGSISEYLRVAAQIRSTQDQVSSTKDLVTALERASTSSDQFGRKVVILTLIIAFAAVIQAIATAWPYLSWWVKHL